MDLSLVERLDINGDGQLGTSESNSLSAFNKQNNQINSSDFTPNAFEVDIDMANEWVNESGENLSKFDLAHMALVKEFGSEELANEIREKADLKYDGDSMVMNFNVDGIDFTLTTNYDPNAEQQMTSILTNSEDDSSSGVFYNPDFENGVAFGDSYTDENGTIISQWQSENAIYHSENDFVISGEENGVAFTRDNTDDSNKYTQTYDDGTFVNVENGVITNGTYNNGVDFTRTDVSNNGLNYTDTTEDGNVYHAQDGVVTHGTHDGIDFTRTNIDGPDTYTQSNSDGLVINVEDGVVTGGTYQDGTDFTRTNFSGDNTSYTEENQWGTMNVVNGLIVNGTDVNGVDYTRSNIEDNMNYTQTSADGTVINVEDGLITNGTYSDGTDFTRTNVSEDNMSYTETNKWGTANVENGIVVSGTDVNGIGYTRSNIEDNMNYTQTSADGTVINVENGLIVSGNYANGVGFSRENISADNSSYIEHQSNGDSYQVANGELASSLNLGAKIEEFSSLNDQISEFIALDSDLARASGAELRLKRELLKDELLQSDSLDSLNRPDLIINKEKHNYFIELNKALLIDLENQMSEFIAKDTDVARDSARDIRLQISITKGLIDFHQGSAGFYETLLNKQAG